MSGTVKRVAVRLALEGADPVRAQLTAVGQTGEQAMQRVQRGTDAAGISTRRFNQAVTQGGFQLQDFAVQVQAGTSALTAFGQQAPQFLGIFGPGGAVAGAVVAVGALAAGLLLGADNANAFALAEEKLGEVYARNRELVRDLTQETQNLAAARLSAGLAETQVELGRARLAQDRVEQERTSIQRENELARRAQGALDAGLITQNQQRLDELNQRAARAGETADRIQQDVDRLTELRRQFISGEGLPTPPTFAAPPAEGGGSGRSTVAAEREISNALRERDQILRRLETPYDAYVRRLEELGALQDRLPEAERLTNDQLQRTAERLQEDLDRAERGTERVDDTARQLGLTFTSAFEDAIIKGEDFRTVLKGIEQDLARLIIRKAITEPAANAISGVNWSGVGSAIGNWLFGPNTSTGTTPGVMASASGPLYSANGNVFAGGNVVPFARGGVVGGPTFFPMANGGVGLMGEAGPEAIMPLQRDGAGRLGVRAQGGGGATVFNISIDARGADAGVDQRIRAGMALAVAQAKRELIGDVNRGGAVAKTFGRRA